MLELTVKGNEVSINAAGVADRLLIEAAEGVGSLIGQIASSAPDSLDKDRLMSVMLKSFNMKLAVVMTDRFDHKRRCH